MLTGPAVLVSCAGLLGLRVQLLGPLKPLCFTLLGIVIGCTVTPDALRAALAWPLSFSILAVSVVCTTLYAAGGCIGCSDLNGQRPAYARFQGI